MTIFQKMLFTPILALLLFTFVTVYSYFEQQESSRQIENFSKDYMPIIELGNQNIMLFEQINQQIKDAIVASEDNWLVHSQTPSQQLIDNLQALTQYKNLIVEEEIGDIRLAFLDYFTLSTSVAKTAISQQSILDINTDLIEQLELSQQKAKSKLINFNEAMKAKFLFEVQDTNRQVDNLLLTTSMVSIVSMAILLLVTLYFSLTTRARIDEVIQRMKHLSQGETDFSNRLKNDKKDEVSYLIYWFNKLSDKLESNYLEIERVSITDKLTQLNNRTRCDSYILSAIHTAQRDGTNLASVIMDIDHFKSINDTYGHLVGDNVLKQVADIMRSEATQSDFIGRWGGEEFIVLVSDLSYEEVVEKIEKLRHVIEQQHFNDVSHITASFGISIFVEGDTQESLLERADSCLYKAKEAGRNKVVFELD